VIALRRIDHVCLRVADVAAAARRYSLQFGLTIREQTAERATLACDYEPFSLELIAGEPLGFAHCAWQLRGSCTLDDARAHIASTGTAFEDAGERLVVRDGRALSTTSSRRAWIWTAAHDRPLDERATSAAPAKARSHQPPDGGHGGLGAFATQVLGMEVSDYLGDAGVWLRVNSEHHQLSRSLTWAARISHHLAFDYYDFRVAARAVRQPRPARPLARGGVRSVTGSPRTSAATRGSPRSR